MPSDATHHLILYDGLCAMCNRFVRFVIRRDTRDVFRFASLQGAAGVKILAGQKTANSGMKTIYLVLNYESPYQQILDRSDAVVFILQELGRFWSALARIAGKLPRSTRDSMYNFIARNRYHLARKLDSCPIPSPQDQPRFLT